MHLASKTARYAFVGLLVSFLTYYDAQNERSIQPSYTSKVKGNIFLQNSGTHLTDNRVINKKI